jgi:ribonuclease T1
MLRPDRQARISGQWTRRLTIVAVTLLAAAFVWMEERGAQQGPQRPDVLPVEVATPDDHDAGPIVPTERDAPVAGADPATESQVPDHRETHVIRDVTIRGLSGKVVYRGDVDLQPTLDRIARGEAFPHHNDGGVFRNLERRLPRQPGGYYHEYVHPTPGLDGPGPQRLVIGKDHEVYYTHDHYQTFQKVR